MTQESLVKSSERIRVLLKVRIDELNLTLKQMEDEGRKYGQNFTVAAISKYLNKKGAGSLTESALIWLCTRYGINCMLIVGNIKINEGKIKYTELSSYDENICINRTLKLFPLKQKEDGKLHKRRSAKVRVN